MIDSNETKRTFRSPAFGSITARACLDAVKPAAVHRPKARSKGVGNVLNSRPLWLHGPPRSATYRSSVFGEPWSKPPATSAVKPEVILKVAKNVGTKSRRPDGPPRLVALKNVNKGSPLDKPTVIPVAKLSPEVSGNEHEVLRICHELVECDKTGGKLTSRTTGAVGEPRISFTYAKLHE